MKAAYIDESANASIDVGGSQCRLHDLAATVGSERNA